jgi:hypothetical protein
VCLWRLEAAPLFLRHFTFFTAPSSTSVSLISYSSALSYGSLSLSLSLAECVIVPSHHQIAECWLWVSVTDNCSYPT